LLDLLIIDIMMPVLNSLDLNHEMRSVEDKFKMFFLTAGLVYYKDLEKKHQIGLMIIRLFIKPIGNESLMV
jgi:two-component SAPR family response regulator